MKQILRFHVPLVAGLLLMAAAVFATQLGLDHNIQWGTRRTILFSAGLLISLLAVFIRYRRPIVNALPGRARAPFSGLAHNRGLRFLWDHRLATALVPTVLLILGVYLFLLTAGSWTTWPEISRYYDDLATAFQHGRLDLNLQSPPALLALPDPYEPSARNSDPALKAFVDQAWDLSFYGGRFYLYWGPAPAFLLFLLKFFNGPPIPDQFLVFFFLVGLFVFTSLLVLDLRRRYCPDTPLSLALCGVLVAGLAPPITWMLSRPAIYEATIAAGQFFLMAGLYLAFHAVAGQSTSRAKLLAAAVLWTIAAMSRTLVLIPAAFLTAMGLLWLLTSNTGRKLSLKSDATYLAVALPLAIGLLITGWYNWARFGSAVETGLRYTLTFHNLDKFYSECFSAVHVLPSLYMYLFDPFRLQARFPFISATFGQSPSLLYFGPSDIYHTEEVTGLVFSVPFILFSIPAIIGTVRRAFNQYVRPMTAPTDLPDRAFTWISICLAGSGLLSFAAILFYFNVTMRFLAEFIPPLIPLSMLGVWQGYGVLKDRPAVRNLYVVFTLCLALVTVMIGLLLALSQNWGRFQHYSPHLMRQLVLFFGR